MLIAEQKRKENIAEFILYIWQLEDILRAYNFDIETINEHIIKRFNQPESVQLQKRQWYVNMIEALYGEKYTKDNIDQIGIIPYSNNEKFELRINKNYWNASNVRIPLFQARAHYKTYLYDLNRQEMLNKIDMQKKLEKYPGLQVGNADEPNNNAGNWE